VLNEDLISEKAALHFFVGIKICNLATKQQVTRRISYVDIVVDLVIKGSTIIFWYERNAVNQPKSF
jgi:hypothetical protein